MFFNSNGLFNSFCKFWKWVFHQLTCVQTSKKSYLWFTTQTTIYNRMFSKKTEAIKYIRIKTGRHNLNWVVSC